MEVRATWGSKNYPVTLEVRACSRFERAQLAVRLLVWLVLGMLGRETGGLFLLLYLLLPVTAAVLITHRSGAAYLKQDAKWLCAVLEWLAALMAYMLFITDRFPLEPERRSVRLRVHPEGAPSTSSALMRLVMSVPHLLFLWILGVVAFVFWLVSAACILFNERQPQALQNYQIGLLAWSARAFVYHASLVETYPPFSLDSPTANRTQAT